MNIRPLNLVLISLILLLSACVSSEEKLQLGHQVQLLPARALLKFADINNDEFYKFIFNNNQYTVIEKGSEDKRLPTAFHKIPGLPEGYHVGWSHMGKGSIFEANYYNIVWLEKSASGRQQLVMFAPSDENQEAIAKALKADPKDGPQIKNAEEMVGYANTLHKMRDTLKQARLDVYDLSKKADYAEAKSMTGAEFLEE